MMRYFFLNEKRIAYRGNKLIGNPRLVKFDPAKFWIAGLTAPSPSYATVNELVKNDKRFKEFRKETNPETIKLLLKYENIIHINEFIFGSKYDDDQAGNMIRHVIEGNRDPKKFSGIHYLPDPLPDFVINFKEVAPPNQYGVYTATFEVKHNGKIISKEENSSMFPSSWPMQRLYDECLHALTHKVKMEDAPRGYKSKTLSGIPVEIYFDKDEKKIKTLYPIYEST